MKNELIMFECELDVMVRKYQVDIPGLQQLLRSHKNMSNKELADRLHIPLTQVEHYFRTDKYFAIPDRTIWFELKKILQISDDSFDKAITTFVTQPGVYEKANRIYGDFGICPTVLCTDEIKVLSIREEQ